MKIYGKKTIKIDCTWEFEDNAELRVKLESLSENELIDEGFEPYVSDDEFILEIEDDDTRFIKFLECIKFAHNPNPGYGFLINGIESVKDEDFAKSLMFKVNETLELSDEDKLYKWW